MLILEREKIPLTPFYFILSNEFNAYLKQIKVILSAVKKISFFFTSDEYDLYFFTTANRGCSDNFELNFLPERFRMQLFCLALRYGRTHVKKVTDVTF